MPRGFFGDTKRRSGWRYDFRLRNTTKPATARSSVITNIAHSESVGMAATPPAPPPAQPPTRLESRVTAPVRARSLPDAFAPVISVMLASARMLPANDVVLPSVAEEPTYQNTLQPEPPLIMFTLDALAVVSVLPIWKMNTALGLPWALSVSAPVNCADVAKQ